MRVLHVDPEHGWGGGEAQVSGLIRELAAKGHRSVLAAPAEGPLARAVAGQATVVDCPIANDLDLRCVPRLRAAARDVDVVHFHTARAHAMAPFLLGTPALRIVTRRMDYVPRGGAWVRWRYNRAVDRVIAISEGVRQALIEAGVDAGRIRVVPSGVAPEAFEVGAAERTRVRREWGIGDETVAVVVVGALERRKGHHVLLAAAATGRVPHDVAYVFCGHGSQEDALRQEARSRGVAVHFAGFRSDIAACLAAADVVALPSLHEGLGVAALEAMAAGRPVLASAVGGLPEVVVDGGTGLLVPPGDVARLADGLRDLVADADRRRTLGAAGATRVRRLYSLRAMAEGTLACYLDAT